jgi:osmotically-inducible protein OsmY
MTKPSNLFHPSLEAGASVGETTTRHSLFDTKDEFIVRIAPVGVAAIYFGSFTLSPQDAPLSRQALFKLSFLYRNFLQPGGISIVVSRQTAVLSGKATNRSLVLMAEILALQIEGILAVENKTEVATDEATDTTPAQSAVEATREAISFLYATDQTLRSGVQIIYYDGALTVQGEVSSVPQKNWAEQIAEAVGGEVKSRLTVNTMTPFAGPHMAEPPLLDDESLQALVLFRLRLVRETEHLPVRVKAVRGVVTLQGKVRTEALRQRAENLTRSTLGLRELRSTLSIGV